LIDSFYLSHLAIELLLSEEKCTDERNGKKRRLESEREETSTHPGRLLPLKVQASFNGQMKEMEETSRGTWASVSWPFQSTNSNRNRYDDSDLDPDSSSDSDFDLDGRNGVATYQLILEFNDTNYAEGVLTHLSKLLDTQSMTDVTFVVQNERIDAHAIVVSANPVICAMVEKGKFEEGHTRTVEIEDIEPAVFKEMLRYLYTGKVQKLDEDEMTEPLLLAADKYQIEALKDLCEQSFIRKLNLETVVHYLVLAHLHSAHQLLEASLKFLETHKKEVWARPEWKELMMSYPDFFLSVSERMIV
jgi:hypothetical protein